MTDVPPLYFLARPPVIKGEKIHAADLIERFAAGTGQPAGRPQYPCRCNRQPRGSPGQPVCVHSGRACGRPRVCRKGAGGRGGGHCGTAPHTGDRSASLCACERSAGCDDCDGRQLPRRIPPAAGWCNGQRGQDDDKGILPCGFFRVRQNPQDRGQPEQRDRNAEHAVPPRRRYAVCAQSWKSARACRTVRRL